MSIAPGSNTHRQAPLGAAWAVVLIGFHPPTSQSPARRHAAPTELMVSRRPACYKHAAPDGAFASRHAVVLGVTIIEFWSQQRE